MKDDGDGQEEEEEEDIEKALEREKKALELERSKKPGERRFQAVDSGANNCLFVRTTLDTAAPEGIVERIFGDILKAGEQRSRYIMRLVPIAATCKAYDKNIEAAAEGVLGRVFHEGADLSYSVLFKTRNNNQACSM